MQRIAFQLRIHPDRIEEYDEAHRHVWAELIEDMQRAGASEYSIFREGTQLFLTLRVPDWESFLVAMRSSDANARWQQKMAPLFVTEGNPMAGGAPALMQEVFYMPGKDHAS